jgi:hypothetical protein
MKKIILATSLLIAFVSSSNAWAADQKLQKAGAEMSALMKSKNITVFKCSTLKPVNGVLRTIEIKNTKSSVDSSGITIESSQYNYGTNEVKELFVSNTTLITFGEEANYTLLLDTSYLGQNEAYAKLIDNEAEDGKYVPMNCELQ